MFQLDNKIALITGGGSGIGKAIAELFARQGARVHIIELNNAAGVGTVEGIRAKGGHAEVHCCDVTDHAAVQALFDRIAAEQGRLDILVNNAGIAHIGNLEKTSAADFDKILSVNVKGTYNCLHAAIGTMTRQGGGGVILNMASIVASVGIPDRFAYTTSKAAVVGMTLSVAKDYIAQGIRCNCMSPARVHTPFVDGYLAANYPGREAEMFGKLSKTQPIGRMARPEEIAALALYLCSDEAAFVTGCDYPIDGGFIKLNN